MQSKSSTSLLILAVSACASSKPAAVSVGSDGTSATALPASTDLCRLAQKRNEPKLVSVCGSVKQLGVGTFTGLGIISNGGDILKAVNSNATGRDELTVARRFFAFDVFHFTVSANSGELGLDMVLRTAAAIDALKKSQPAAYEFITASTRPPTDAPMAGTLWKNSNEKIIISFDKTPVAIAASGTLLGSSVKEPSADGKESVDLYRNYALISIDEESILGTAANIGSRRIYKLESPEANYRRYMEDGFVFTLVHESVHLYITYLNSTGPLTKTIFNDRNTNGIDAEEVVANKTASAVIGTALSSELRAEIDNENRIIAAKPGVATLLTQWGALNRTPQTQILAVQ